MAQDKVKDVSKDLEATTNDKMESNTANNKPITDESPGQREEEWEIQRDEYKALGDDAFRNNELNNAVQHYTNALSLDPNNHIILSNRSAANLKLNNKSKALQDARSCIEKCPEFAKGHSRLAAAQYALGRYEFAKLSYQKVLSIDSENKIAVAGVENCTNQIRIQKQNEIKIMQEQLNAKEAKEKAEKQKEETEQGEEQKLANANDDDEGDEEDDLLSDFFSEVDTVSADKKKKEPADDNGKKESDKNETKKKNIIQKQKQSLGTAQEQINRLLQPRYEWRNLNPFFVLDMPHTSSIDDISRRYKALSLLLHPDKCRSLEHAKDAYDEVQRAKKVLDDEDKLRHTKQLIEQGMKIGKEEYRKKQKENPNTKITNSEGEESLLDVQNREIQRIFAQIEYKRRDVEKRKRQYEQREQQQEDDEIKKEKDKYKFEKTWKENNRVDNRVNNWRDFSSSSSTNKKQRI